MRGLEKNSCGHLMQAFKEGEDGVSAKTDTSLPLLR